jgi:hypothetical protein
MNEASGSTYALMVQTSVPGATSSSRWIEGRATFTIVTSSRIMNWAKQAAISVQRWRAGLIGRRP